MRKLSIFVKGPTYANVTATLALILSMSAGALAAKRYIITSPSQIKPSVLKQLHGQRGQRGEQGIAGALGVQGLRGLGGPAGPQGIPGIPGSLGVTGEVGPTGPTGGGATGPTGPEGSHTGPTGPTGEKGATGATGGGTGGSGTTGPTGPTGPTGTGGGGGGGREACVTQKGPPERIECSLVSKGTETGAWSATIHAPAGTEQVQTQAAASFPIKLKTNEAVTLTYRNEEQSLAPAPPCLGSAQEPLAEPGNFCTYRGGNTAGIKEKGVEVGNIDKNAKFFAFNGANGEHITKTGLANEGDESVLLVFRTNEFSEETPIDKIALESNLNAQGSWAVTAK
jgi:Collagen triple helix repeat (20 copies)